ncbi:MAG: hypothetical protein LBQ50_03415 [Planctomycetaceae bacterium]|jgi:hypothetical protein|nr:hypothetical protein [Planctomycetaceae bacterium]
MNRIHQTKQNLILRWVTSAAVLFYVLLPPVGACQCADCSCCHHSGSQEVLTASFSNEKTCCSSACSITENTENVADIVNAVSEKCNCLKSLESSKNSETSGGCCSNKPEKNKENNSESCPCYLKTVPETSSSILQTSVSLQQISEQLKADLLSSFVSVTLPTTNIEPGFYNQSFESPVSRLPVRLHLLLLVLLN